MALSLTEYATSAAASICAGSVVEIAGAFFTFAGDEAIEASTWTSIVTGNTAYITLTASGTAGSQIVVAAYTSTAPTWRDDLQGWYASAASNVRVIGSVYKAEATSYYPKYIYGNEQDGKYRFTGSLSILGVVSASSSISVSGDIKTNGYFQPYSVNDVFHISGMIAGSVPIFTATAATSASTTSYVNLHNYRTNYSGTLRIDFYMAGGPGITHYGRVYKNGIAYGTERTNTTTVSVLYSEDLSFNDGDTIEIWGKVSSAINYTVISSFSINSSTPKATTYGYF